GVRYCPSIEDKVVKFKERTRHQIFLEPEGLTTNEYYPNGLSTSLPLDVQENLIHSIEGLENALITKPGYGIEHDVIDPTQLYPTLESKLIKSLFFAGQINGTTGYEEAAAQGLVAGINAVLKLKEKEPFILPRSTSYIGVLIDDLTTKGTNEPYRMFTSRVEYRLILREDNADLRLTRLGYELGLIPKDRYQDLLKKEKNIEEELNRIRNTKIMPSPQINKILTSFNTVSIRKPTTLEELLKRHEINYEVIKNFNHCSLSLSKEEIEQVEIEAKYSSFIQRQFNEVDKFKHLEKIKIPQNLDYQKIPGISREIKEKLNKFKPISLGQASRISGITPASISLLMVWLRKKEIDAKI
ncbi:MAG: FAD-dependent oxidoreductase, partial [Candidatus Omnitrophota bacterium]